MVRFHPPQPLKKIFIINSYKQFKKEKICVVTKIASVTLVPVIHVNVDKEFVRNFVMSPMLWFIGIVILMIIAW